MRSIRILEIWERSEELTLTLALKAQSKREREAFHLWQEQDSEFGDLNVICLRTRDEWLMY